MEAPLSGENAPASSGLHKGDVVRVTRMNRMPRYQPGDKGMIVMGAKRIGAGRISYLVAMDKDNPPRVVIFAEDEIEPDR